MHRGGSDCRGPPAERKTDIGQYRQLDRQPFVADERQQHDRQPERPSQSIAHQRYRHDDHQRDLARNLGWVWLRGALDRKFPAAPFSLPWQYLFASGRISDDPRSSNRGRHHVHEGALQRAFSETVRGLGWTKRATCHTLRHTFATRLYASDVNPRAVQELMGHWRLEMTMDLYTGSVPSALVDAVSRLDRRQA